MLNGIILALMFLATMAVLSIIATCFLYFVMILLNIEDWPFSRKEMFDWFKKINRRKR